MMSSDVSHAWLESLVGDVRLAALLEVLWLAASADGDVGDEELVQLTQSLQSLTEKRISASEALDLLRSFAREPQPRLVRLGRLRETLASPGLRLAALDLAARVAAADGIVRTSEREVLAEVAEGLGLDRDQAADVIARASS
jgi:tellurite resistance protein